MQSQNSFGLSLLRKESRANVNPWLTDQALPFFEGTAPTILESEPGAALGGNANAQVSHFAEIEFGSNPPSAAVPKVEVGEDHQPSSQSHSRLQALKSVRFSAYGRLERVARSLAALHRQGTIHLTADQWKRVAMDADAEDQF